MKCLFIAKPKELNRTLQKLLIISYLNSVCFGKNIANNNNERIRSHNKTSTVLRITINPLWQHRVTE